jgi:hypothetical protein
MKQGFQERSSSYIVKVFSRELKTISSFNNALTSIKKSGTLTHGVGSDHSPFFHPLATVDSMKSEILKVQKFRNRIRSINTKYDGALKEVDFSDELLLELQDKPCSTSTCEVHNRALCRIVTNKFKVAFTLTNILSVCKQHFDVFVTKQDTHSRIYPRIPVKRTRKRKRQITGDQVVYRINSNIYHTASHVTTSRCQYTGGSSVPVLECLIMPGNLRLKPCKRCRSDIGHLETLALKKNEYSIATTKILIKNKEMEVTKRRKIRLQNI